MLLAQAAPALPPSTADYAKSANWLCLPGRKDVCSTPLATTALTPDGYGATGPSAVARDPAVDCFYVYPTVSGDAGLNSDLVPGREERLMVETQFARFAGVCRPFVPVYRQMTVAAVAAAAVGSDLSAAGLTAYADVRNAWRQYLKSRNGGRPFVLVGHSQGALMVQQLIAREIETDVVLAKRMKLAIIPGYNAFVPQGRRVGGTFKRTPTCARPGETNCVVTWASFREKNAPPPGALFGYAGQAGMTVACVNPARFGAAGWVPLDSYWFTRSTLPVPGGPIDWSSEGKPPTPYVRTEGLASGRCVNQGARGYLSVRTNADPGDKRTDRIGGEVGLFGMFLPGWGMHLADMALAQGDLLRAVAAIEAAERKK
jgi:pimeloyl-ACP methyl ester carboxylesterase